MTVNGFDEYTRRVAPLPWVHSVWLFPQPDGGQRLLVCVDESRQGDALLSELHPTRGQPASSACHTLVPPVIITRSMLARLPLFLSESAGQISQLSGEERAPLPPLNEELRRASLFLNFLGNAPTCFAALVLLRSRQVLEVAPAYRSVLLLLHHCAAGENGLLGERIASAVRALRSSCQELAARLTAGPLPLTPSAVALVDKTLSLYLDCVSVFDEKSGQTTALFEPRLLAEMSLRTDDAVLVPVAGEQIAALKKAGPEAFYRCDAQMSSCAMVPVPLTWTALTMQGLRLYPGTGFRAYLRSVSGLEWEDREASEWLGGSWAALLEQRVGWAAEQLELLKTHALDFGLGPPCWDSLSRFQSLELRVSRARVDNRIISIHLSDLMSLDAAEERGEHG